jgi:hypothetical protein
LIDIASQLAHDRIKLGIFWRTGGFWSGIEIHVN